MENLVLTFRGEWSRSEASQGRGDQSPREEVSQGRCESEGGVGWGAGEMGVRGRRGRRGDRRAGSRTASLENRSKYFVLVFLVAGIFGGNQFRGKISVNQP